MRSIREVEEVAVEFLLQAPAAHRAQPALDGHLRVLVRLRAQRVRDEMQRLLVHRATLQRVESTIVRAAPGLQALLQQRRDRALGAARRAPQQQDAAARLVALRRRLEVTHDAVQGHVEPEQVAREEVV